MKTTLDTDNRLLAEAKATAVLERSTLARLIEEGLVLRLRRSGGVSGTGWAGSSTTPKS